MKRLRARLEIWIWDHPALAIVLALITLAGGAAVAVRWLA